MRESADKHRIYTLSLRGAPSSQFAILALWRLGLWRLVAHYTNLFGLAALTAYLALLLGLAALRAASGKGLRW